MPLFALAIFTSSFLLFLVQPMVSKMLLPSFGGAPSVWLTCLFFFQAMLLAGYAYVHVAAARLSTDRQKLLHALLLVAACFFLPLHPIADISISAFPAIPLLVALLKSLGLPFAVLGSTAPLLQRWFSRSSLRGADHPYPLYAVSNLGSLLGLVVYPFVIEPGLTIPEQSRLVAVLFLAAALIILACALVAREAARSRTAPSLSAPIPSDLGARWVILAFVPSSLLLSVTSTITLDIAAIPLLWVIPLALYLVTFSIAFARRPLVPHAAAMRLAPVFIILTTVWISSLALPAHWLATPLLLHLATFFFVALACHGALAEARPPADQLTGFYLRVALGGCLGGIFNSLLAPVLFDRVIEYPLVLALAAVLVSPADSRCARRDLILPLALGLAYLVIDGALARSGLVPGRVASSVAMAIPAAVAFRFLGKPVRMALACGVLLFAAAFVQDYHGQIIRRERSFFGVYKVSTEESPALHTLTHGTTVHGREWFLSGRIDEPLTYYHPTGPAGRIYETFRLGDTTSPVAVVGLGAGSMAAYAESGRAMDFYEIDPAMEGIARDPRCFQYLARSRGRVRVRLGDARLSLRSAAEKYGLIVLDAFSSDAIPVHLLTRQALSIYLACLSDDGILAFHISNNYLDLAPVLRNLAAERGLFCLLCDDVKSAELQGRGVSSSLWVVMGRHEKTFDKPPITSGGWIRLIGATGDRTWTDDYAPVASVFRWR